MSRVDYLISSRGNLIDGGTIESGVVVMAIFDRSIIVESSSDIISIVSPALGAGPYNLVTNSEADFLRLRSNTAVGQVLSMDSTCIRSSGWTLDFSCAHDWDANIKSFSHSCQSLSTVLERLHQLIEIAPNDVFVSNGFISSSVSGKAVKLSTVMDAAMFSYLDGVLLKTGTGSFYSPETSVDVPQTLFGLLGAGRGLTPTGDDVLVGILLALNLLYFDSLNDSSKLSLQESVKSSTQPFSAQFVVAAADGFVGEALYDIFQHIAVNDQFDATVLARQIQAIGYSSGWDTLAGFYYVCRNSVTLKNSIVNCDKRTVKQLNRLSHA